MATTAAQTTHEAYLDRLNTARDHRAFAQIFNEMTHTERAQGWADDIAPGLYFNGHLIFTKAPDGSRWYTEIYALPAHTTELWAQADRAQQDEDRFVAEAMRQAESVQRGRGRPGIGEEISFRIPAWLLHQVDLYAAELGEPRAVALRRLVIAGSIAMGGPRYAHRTV